MTHCEHYIESKLLILQHLWVHGDFYRLQRGRYVAFCGTCCNQNNYETIQALPMFIVI